MPGTSDPIVKAANKLMLVLSEYDDIIDDAAAATYEGDYFGDLVSGKAEDTIRVMGHNEETFAKIIEALTERLQKDADLSRKIATEGRIS
jgi:hypothetical protein